MIITIGSPAAKWAGTNVLTRAVSGSIPR